jgi:CRISPR-associated endonuclease Cas1
MRNQASPPLAYTVNRGTVCVAAGHHITVRVRHGRLIVEDGFAAQRRSRVYTRVTDPLARLVVVGNGGSVSLEALSWLRDTGAAFIHVARDGRLITTTAAETADARLRRAQALAPISDWGVEVGRWILTTKVAGQERILQSLTSDPDLLAAMDDAVSRLEQAVSIDEFVWAERDAALAYWNSWWRLPVQFATRDRGRVPDHWHTFGQRTSPLTGAPRLAVNPANAILNYLYALLEAEARLALLTVGLDPTVGIVHADSRGRDSLALDLMEAARPDVDQHVLTLLHARVFRASDFAETRQGACRIQTPLCEELGKTATKWRGALSPAAEQLARDLAKRSVSDRRPLPTPLTRTNRIAARAAVRRQTRQPAVASRMCKRCGGELPHRRRTYCDTCLPAFREEQLRVQTATCAAEGALKRQAVDASHGGVAAKRRGDTNQRRKVEVREWDERHGKLVDLGAFDREILPLIQHVSLSRLCRATGLSLRYISQVRRGEKRPHPRHWAALRAAAATGADER